MTEPPLTLEEHRALGRELQLLRHRLWELHHDLFDRYGTLVSKHVDEMLAELGNLRSALSDCVDDEHPGSPVANARIYYGMTPSDAEETTDA